MSEETLVKITCNNCGKVENVYISRCSLTPFLKWIKVSRDERIFNFCSKECYNAWRRRCD